VIKNDTYKAFLIGGEDDGRIIELGEKKKELWIVSISGKMQHYVLYHTDCYKHLIYEIDQEDGE